MEARTAHVSERRVGLSERPEQQPTFGTLLRRLRGASGLTQEELTSRAGLTPNAVSTLERGTRKHPYPHTVRSLAEALELSEDERAALLAAVPGRARRSLRGAGRGARSKPPYRTLRRRSWDARRSSQRYESY
jgi:transcriptional regulator with XRE-family HTH domain